MKALERCQVLAIAAPDFLSLVKQVPRFHYHISMMVKTRTAA